MVELPSVIAGSFLFVSLFFEVFLLLTFLENKPKVKNIGKTSPVYYPTATVIVPCFNEEASIFGTVESLLALDYPKDKLKIMIVDDGSTDNSWNLLQKYKNHSQIELFKKENGGKHTAMNFAIGKSNSEIIGCLDADSFVGANTLKDIVTYFADEKIMAVIPSIKIHSPDNILRKIQKVEYDWGIFLRKMLSHLDALYVTPGPFSFFRREVFNTLGRYKNAHNTEDMEIAMRMQKHGYQIKNCHTAFVHTIAPNKFPSLFKQRLRWTNGFIRNILDYRELFFHKTQGNLGFLILPVLIVTAISTMWFASSFIINIFQKTKLWFLNWKAINFDLSHLNFFQFNFEWFYVNTNIITFMMFITLLLTIGLVLLGRKFSEGKIKYSSELLYFFIIYPFIAPTWLFKAVYNVVVSKDTKWR